MESLSSRLVKVLLRAMRFNEPYKAGKFDLDEIRKHDMAQPNRWMCKGCRVDNEIVESHKVWSITPHKITNKKVLFYLHGGAFLGGLVKQQWNTLAKIGRLSGAKVIVPEYPLAPENNYKDALGMVLNTYHHVLKQTEPNNIIFIGDSAGGGLMFSLVLLLQEKQIDLPAKLVALSPWVDASMSNPAALALEPKDPMIQVAGLKTAGELYANGSEVTHYLVSPLYGKIKEFPETHIFAGTDDVLQPDEKLFAEKARKNGIDTYYYEYPNMIHAWMFLPIPEAKQAIQKIVNICTAN